ncbi:hypothetical protein QWZ13_14035 [Reinekea marina]|nr:hypothetical protein [Reinekea marina]MDN3650036.1 hypothetical protein [Reinekea marina]
MTILNMHIHISLIFCRSTSWTLLYYPNKTPISFMSLNISV